MRAEGAELDETTAAVAGGRGAKVDVATESWSRARSS